MLDMRYLAENAVFRGCRTCWVIDMRDRFDSIAYKRGTRPA